MGAENLPQLALAQTKFSLTFNIESRVGERERERGNTQRPRGPCESLLTEIIAIMGYAADTTAAAAAGAISNSPICSVITEKAIGVHYEGI